MLLIKYLNKRENANKYNTHTYTYKEVNPIKIIRFFAFNSCYSFIFFYLNRFQFIYIYC